MADELMALMGVEEDPKRGDYVFDTVVVGMTAMTSTLVPVLVWWLYERNRPGMASFDSSNDWYYISWWAMWVGHLVAFSAPSLLWIPAYFSSRAAMIYGLTWVWAMGIGAITFIFTWTSLLVSGIEWPDNKEIWVTFLLYSICSMMLMQFAKETSMGAKIWYMWDTFEENCERDADGNCTNLGDLIDAHMEDEGQEWDY